MPGTGELAVLIGALIGAGLGFLWFNAPPAAIFMGDTGSLALGGMLGAIAVATKHEIVLAIIGGIFVVEALSVIIQVASFKLTGKRVFRMAPIHHHFEQLGWTEPQVVIRFWIIAVVLALDRPLDAEAEVRMAIALTHLRGRSIGVFGLARSGLATVRAAVAGGAAEVFVWDDKESARDEAGAARRHRRCEPADWPWTALDRLVLSPGVPLTHPKPHAIVGMAKAAGVAIVSDIELLWCEAEGRARFVAITGTNGKSTTTALIGHVLTIGRARGVGRRQYRPRRARPRRAGGRAHLRARDVVLSARPHALFPARRRGVAEPDAGPSRPPRRHGRLRRRQDAHLRQHGRGRHGARRHRRAGDGGGRRRAP